MKSLYATSLPMLLLSFSCSDHRIEATPQEPQHLRGLKKDKESKEDSKEDAEVDQRVEADTVEETSAAETCFFEPPHYRCYRNRDNGAQLTAVCPSPLIEANSCACKVTVPSPSGDFVNCNSCHLYEYGDDWGVDVDCSNVFGVAEGSVAADSVVEQHSEVTSMPSRAPSHPPTLAPTPRPTPVPTNIPSASPTHVPQAPLPFLFGSSAFHHEESIIFYEDALPSPVDSPSLNDVQLTMRNSRTRPPSIDPETWHMGGH